MDPFTENEILVELNKQLKQYICSIEPMYAGRFAFIKWYLGEFHLISGPDYSLANDTRVLFEYISLEDFSGMGLLLKFQSLVNVIDVHTDSVWIEPDRMGDSYEHVVGYSVYYTKTEEDCADVKRLIEGYFSAHSQVVEMSKVIKRDVVSRYKAK